MTNEYKQFSDEELLTRFQQLLDEFTTDGVFAEDLDEEDAHVIEGEIALFEYDEALTKRGINHTPIRYGLEYKLMHGRKAS